MEHTEIDQTIRENQQVFDTKGWFSHAYFSSRMITVWNFQFSLLPFCFLIMVNIINIVF